MLREVHGLYFFNRLTVLDSELDSVLKNNKIEAKL